MLNWTTGGTDTGLGDVLLLHAFPLSSGMWRPQLEALATAGYRAIAPNSYGIEGSTEKQEWSFTEYAHDLAILMESLNMKNATIAGLSMGGYQALEFARLYPEKTASLVLADTRAEEDAPEAAAARREFITAIERGGAEEAVRRMVPNYFSESAPREHPELIEEASAMIRSQSPEAITSAMKAIMSRRDQRPLLPAITCPALVICGSDDRLTPPETAALISSAIAGAHLEIIQRAGHLANMEQPEAFSAALLNHLQQLNG
ncbi:alpha/beta fold hydrolase [Chlorobium phaeovibrioides]|uniref:Alpha/beta fold hydrolase n=1 Tax=Chlorobium phaeovibrioides TaxID=1094 RepID=A0A432ASM2_CHLPH|nr:alpha/beta fold hydrolase [Chlorobium phaeovibrioides]MWV54806.1 alpha/beta fold hydrolase [Chlorobium phaeovibrioides]QEQ57462.1 alpha/beta fold hydrolase [Chlorobium phaeovibrioides]RTY35957.1 alpha/beta fold hydrolase [Chlorobium phaeovibrioides]